VIDYSQPLVTDTGTSAEPSSEVPAEQPPALTDFDAAREAFYQGDYAKAMDSTNKALAGMPNDAVIHEFRALVLFAQGKYQEAAAGLHAVLAVGPGWDWTTLSSLYASVDTYTQQLRALEAYQKKNPDAVYARFVLAYHYLTIGEKDAAVAQLTEIVKQVPQDTVSKELLTMTAGPDAVPGEESAPPAEEGPAVSASDLVGKWTAAGEKGTKFALDLAEEGNFVWTYTSGDKPQTVKGVYAIEGSTLAMELDSGGTMLTQVSPPTNNAFHLKMLGGPADDPGLDFRRGR
jgi:uncharacterized protein (TIGR03066 family)